MLDKRQDPATRQSRKFVLVPDDAAEKLDALLQTEQPNPIQPEDGSFVSGLAS
jgi:hypothetical protein